MRLHRDERGQTLILVALALPCLVAMIGLAVDAGVLFKDRRTLQTAADAAAIAGALNITNGNWQAAAKAASASNGFTDGASGVTVTITPPTTGPQWPASQYYNAPGYLEATVTKAESTIFMGMFGMSSVNVTARAVATNQAPGNGCVFTLGTSGTDLYVQGSPLIDATSCDFNINSTTSDAIVEKGSGGDIETAAVGVVGNVGTSGFGDFNPKPVSGVAPYSDPLGSMQYPYSCGAAGCTCSGALCSTDPLSLSTTSSTTYKTCTDPKLPKTGQVTINLSPGCYDLQGGETIGSQTTLNLSPGVYLFTDGAITIQAGGTLNGRDITMVMTGTSTINMTGTPNLDIEAPDKTDPTAAFPGILYYQVPADTQTLNLQGGATSIIEGVFYAPSAQINMQGNPGGKIYTEFVSQSLYLLGNASFQSYAKLPGGAAGGMHAIALVE